MNKLIKELSFIDVFSIATGAMISVGVFVLPGLAYKIAGPAAIISYLLAALLYLPAMFSRVELATAMPKAGGDYFFIDRGLGVAAGTMGGMASWFAFSLKSAFSLVGIGAMVQFLLPDLGIWHIRFVAVTFCLLFILINVMGSKHVGKFQVVLVSALLLMLFYFFIRGCYFVNPHNFTPFAPGGFMSIFKVAGLVMISYAGMKKVIIISEEIKDPQKNIPRAKFLAFVFITLIYLLVVFVIIGVTDPEHLAGSLTPLNLAASRFMGPVGRWIMVAGAIMAFTADANAGIMAASRYPLAMSRDGHLPQFFQNIHPKYGTPHTSLIFTGAFIISAIMLLDIEMLVKTASAIIILSFILVTVTLMVIRESKIFNYRPSFRSPLYPYIQVIGVAAYIFVLIEMGAKPMIITSSLLMGSMLWYWIYSRIQVNRESALARMIQGFTSTEYDKPLGVCELGTELKEIARERDDIVDDRFDHIVKNCIILDLPGVELEEFFNIASKKLALHLDESEKFLYRQLAEREQEATTMLRPGLAIPHILLKGSSKFDILIARSKQGIEYDPRLPPVHMIFVLVGSSDERAFYIRALLAVADITRDQEFDEQWLRAENEEQIRDLILMGERNRAHMLFCRYSPDLEEKGPGAKFNKKLKKETDEPDTVL